MSFNNAIKKVLGLGDYGEGVDDLDYFEKRDYDDPWHKDDEENKPKDTTAADKNQQVQAQQGQQQPKPTYTRVELPRQEVDMTGLATSKNDGVPENILNRFVSIINGNLSPHILNHLDVEAEKRSIVDSLKPQFRDYETNLRKDVLDSAAERWNKERAEIIEKLKETDDKALKAHDEIEELKEKVKATENARKAMLTRYNDLQMKMQEMMTAKEKVDMENRSLQNKMKVLQMNEEQGKNNDKAKEELLKLTDELTQERNEAVKSKERISQLQKQVDELKAAKAENATPVVAGDEKLVKALEVKEAEINDLSAQVAWLHHRLDQTSEELDKANEELAQAEELVSQIDKFEEILKRKDDEIAALKQKISEGAETPTILDDLDEGIEFTGDKASNDEEDDKNQMSLF